MFFKPQAREEEGKKRKSPGMAKPSSSLQGSSSSRGLYFRGLPFFIMSVMAVLLSVFVTVEGFSKATSPGSASLRMSFSEGTSFIPCLSQSRNVLIKCK